MNQKPLRLFACNNLAKLLQGPVGGGMSGDVEVSNSAASGLDNHEDVEEPEGHRHTHKEVASEDGPCMIADEAHPALRGDPISRSPSRWNVTPHGTGRDSDPQLEQQLSCDALLAPGRIALGHIGNELSEISRNSWATPRFRFPAPEQLEALPMPTDQCLWLDHDEGISPGEQLGQEGQGQPRRVIGSSRLGPAFKVEGQLLAEEEILRPEGSIGPRAQSDESGGGQKQTAQGM